MGWVFDDGMSFSGLSSGVSTDGMVVWCSNAISNVVPDLKPGEEILEASADLAKGVCTYPGAVNAPHTAGPLGDRHACIYKSATQRAVQRSLRQFCPAAHQPSCYWS